MFARFTRVTSRTCPDGKRGGPPRKEKGFRITIWGIASRTNFFYRPAGWWMVFRRIWVVFPMIWMVFRRIWVVFPRIWVVFPRIWMVFRRIWVVFPRIWMVFPRIWMVFPTIWMVFPRIWMVFPRILVVFPRIWMVFLRDVREVHPCNLANMPGREAGGSTQKGKRR